MTTGDAASLLRSRGVPIKDAQAVRRLCEYGLLQFTWTRPDDASRVDINGRPLRGHRRVYRESVEEYAKRQLRIAKQSPPPGDS